MIVMQSLNNSLIRGRMVCLQYLNPSSDWLFQIFYFAKNSPKKCRASRPPKTVWQSPKDPLNIKCMVPAFFGEQFVGCWLTCAHAGLCTFELQENV
jgi:hypothetical protein